MSGSAPRPASPRLRYRRLTADDARAFLALATDAHVRRYLLDGAVVDRAWTDAEVVRSDAAFAAGGAGLWLVHDAIGADPIGFAGFRVFDEMGPEPQLIYAFVERVTGRGYATEVALALVAHARDTLGWGEILAAVDAPNAASLRVLEKCGFVVTGSEPGVFGPMHLLRLRLR